MSSSVVVLVKTRVFPSGENVAAPAPFGRSVIAFGSPPDMGIRKSCGGWRLPSFSATRTKARSVPSGEKRGVWSPGPAVKRRGGVFPSVAPIQMEVSYSSFFWLGSTRTKATSLPSDETCGSALQTNFATSVSAMRRFAGVAG